MCSTATLCIWILWFGSCSSNKWFTARFSRRNMSRRTNKTTTMGNQNPKTQNCKSAWHSAFGKKLGTSSRTTVDEMWRSSCRIGVMTYWENCKTKWHSTFSKKLGTSTRTTVAEMRRSSCRIGVTTYSDMELEQNNYNSSNSRCRKCKRAWRAKELDYYWRRTSCSTSTSTSNVHRLHYLSYAIAGEITQRVDKFSRGYNSKTGYSNCEGAKAKLYQLYREPSSVT